MFGYGREVLSLGKLRHTFRSKVETALQSPSLTTALKALTFSESVCPQSHFQVTFVL